MLVVSVLKTAKCIQCTMTCETKCSQYQLHDIIEFNCLSKCPVSHPNNSSFICVDNCLPLKLDTTTKRCVDNCSSVLFYEKGECVAKCSDSNPYVIPTNNSAFLHVSLFTITLALTVLLVFRHVLVVYIPMILILNVILSALMIYTWKKMQRNALLRICAN